MLLFKQRLATGLTATLTSVALMGPSAALANDDAANYPNKPIRLIVPSAPGASLDTMARLIGAEVGKSIGQPIIVENKPGASGIIGTTAAARAKADGYTLLYTWTAFIQAPALHNHPPYDVFTDFAPIIEVARSSFVLLGGASLPASTAKDFIALVKNNPGKYNYGSPGNGTSSHILAELLKQSTGIQINHVPYKAGAPMMTDLMAGNIPVAFVDFGTARVNKGLSNIKPLAITSRERSPYFPSTPTFGELGIQGLDLEGWFGVLAPAKTDSAIVKKLAQEFAKAVRSPEIKKRLEDLGVTVVANPPNVFAANLRRDEAKWKKTIIDAAIRMD
ncbi:hypothetical protein AWV79_21570 [Cupriavidus sp. UYMMa02A]|nr:hypothetical protein AWV79_21570 [Cupriavidus sp. UYMMa02A]